MRGLASSRNCAGRSLYDSAVAVVDQGVDAAQRWIVFRENPCFIPHVRFSPPQRADECSRLATPPKTDAGGCWRQLLLASIDSVPRLIRAGALSSLDCSWKYGQYQVLWRVRNKKRADAAEYY